MRGGDTLHQGFCEEADKELIDRCGEGLSRAEGNTVDTVLWVLICGLLHLGGCV